MSQSLCLTVIYGKFTNYLTPLIPKSSDYGGYQSPIVLTATSDAKDTDELRGGTRVRTITDVVGVPFLEPETSVLFY